MIILAGEASYQDEIIDHLRALGYVKEDLLVNLHTKGMFATAPAANQSQLQEWLIDRQNLTIADFSAEMDKSPVSGSEWRARIASLRQQVGDNWFIHDYRPFWFFESFHKEAGPVSIIVLQEGETDYQRAISRFFEKRLPAEFPVLKTGKILSLGEIENFMNPPKGKGSAK